MNNKKNFSQLCITLFGILALIGASRPFLVYSNPLKQISAFLETPYYGSTTVSSIFDHNRAEGQILALTGETAESTNCPCPGAPPEGCVDEDFSLGYYSCDINDYLYYDNHSGIDYLLRYEEVRAVAPGDVVYAGWNSAANHSGAGSGLGLYIRIRHDNEYSTLYGHMSVLHVHSGDEISADADELTRIIGVSGNTGNSSGAHHHFEVWDANNASVDPYGPEGNANNSLWIERPAIASHFAYTSGDHPLTAPSIAEDNRGHFTIDDGDADFVEETTGCWTENNTNGWNGDYLSRIVPNEATCIAAWNFPEAQRAGFYHVFIHIPNDDITLATHSITDDTAPYTITHAVSDDQPWVKQEEIVIVDQWHYPNYYHPSPWAYAGTYYFNSSHGTDSIKLNTALADSRDGTLAADAIRFSPVIYRLYLPLVLKRWPPLPGTPVLNAVNPDHLPDYDVTWNSADLADNYTLQEAGSPTFDDAVTRYSGPATAWPATGKTPGYYYYRVRASNIWGNGPWSNLQQAYVAFPTPTPSPCDQNILYNADFEAGPYDENWEQFSNGGYLLISQQHPRGDGTWGVFMGDFDNAHEWIRQSFTVPSDMDRILLQFWWNITSTETLPFDAMTYGIQDASGTYLHNPITFTSYFKSDSWKLGGAAVSDLSAYANQTLRLNFEATTNGSDPSSFFVDDVILIFPCGTSVNDADLPSIRLFTPTPTPP